MIATVAVALGLELSVGLALTLGLALTIGLGVTNGTCVPVGSGASEAVGGTTACVQPTISTATRAAQRIPRTVHSQR